MENNENGARCTCELKDGVIAVHFKRELADPEDLAREPLLYMYRIIGVAIDADTGKRMVVYKALYGDLEMYVRDEAEFLSEVDRVKYPYVRQIYRFELC